MSEIATVQSSVDSNLSFSTDDLNQTFKGLKKDSFLGTSPINGKFDFVGIGDPSTLNQYIKELVTTLENDFAEYNTKSDIYKGLKGEAAEMAKDYVLKIGNLIKSYTAYYETFVTLSTKTYQQMKTDDKANAKTVDAEAQRIDGVANAILNDLGAYNQGQSASSGRPPYSSPNY